MTQDRALPLLRASECPLSPHPELNRLRDEGPVSRVRTYVRGEFVEVAMVARYQEARAVLEHPLITSGLEPVDGLVQTQPGFLLTMDGPEHQRLRKLLRAEFGMSRMKAWRPMITELVERQLDEMENAGSPLDLVEWFASPIPSTLIATILGVPVEDHDQFNRRSEIFVDQTIPPEVQRANGMAMTEYMTAIVAANRVCPGDNVLGHLIYAHGDELSDAELANLGNLLLPAGHETSASMLALGTLVLLRHPDQLALVRDDPKALTWAIEELLRFLSVTNTGGMRRAVDTFELSGETIQRGEQVIVSLPTANRDAALLDDPDRFDVTRAPTPHLAFGHGQHMCLGQQLVRLELSIALPALLQRFPTLELAIPFQDLQFNDNRPTNGVATLPVQW